MWDYGYPWSAGTSTDRLAPSFWAAGVLGLGPCVAGSLGFRRRDRPRCRCPRHPDPILLTDFPQHCSGTCGCGTRVHHRRDRRARHVEPQTRRSPSGGWRRLLLESRGGLLVYGRPLYHAVAREHAPLGARHSVIRRWNDRTNGETAALAPLAPTAHRRHGNLIHPAAHRVLRGQWTAPAAVAFAAASGALAPAQPRRRSSSGLGTETSLAHSAVPRASTTLRVKTDEGVKASDERDRVMRLLPFHFGWMVLIAGGIGAFMTLPGQTTGVAVFFDPLAADLNLTRPQIALAYTVGTLERRRRRQPLALRLSRLNSTSCGRRCARSSVEERPSENERPVAAHHGSGRCAVSGECCPGRVAPRLGGPGLRGAGGSCEV
jgi:hypothetical protein